MSNRSSALWLFFALAACAENVPEPALPRAGATPSGTAAGLPALERRSIDELVRAFNHHDAAAIGALYAEDGVLSSPAPEGWSEMRGRAVIEQRHRELFAAFPDLELAAPRVFASGSHLALEWMARGTNRGPWLGEPATGKSVGFRAASFITYAANGLITSDHTYMDDVTIAIQLGKAPGQARPAPVWSTAAPEWLASAGTPEEAALVEGATKNWPDLWSKKDRTGYAQAFTPDAVHREIASPNDYVGSNALMAEFEMYAASVPDMSVKVDRIFTAGHFAVLEFTFSGTQTGALGPLPATGKPFTLHALDIDEYRGAQLADANTYSNAREFLTQLGAIPAKTASR